ncbi:hypothetical protein JCM10450v2_000601 [Rhodotorula kratochvilovae]
MAALALPSARTARRTVHQVVASLASRSPIFSASSTLALPAVYTAASSAAGPAHTFSLSLSSAPAVPASPLARLAALIPDSLAAGLRDLLPPWVFAVPKRRTTHGAKRMRSSNKGLKERQNLVSCPSCGAPKLAHHLCHECHVAFRREIHREAKEVRTPEQRA